jgi:hypothetical protein
MDCFGAIFKPCSFQALTPDNGQHTLLLVATAFTAMMAPPWTPLIINVSAHSLLANGLPEFIEWSILKLQPLLEA